jgi:hypothetical protein
MIPHARLEKQAKQAEVKLQQEMFDKRFNPQKKASCFLTSLTNTSFPCLAQTSEVAITKDGQRNPSKTSLQEMGLTKSRHRRRETPRRRLSGAIPKL